jgi:putative membrane-bound dehydrogenase-like protein
MDIYAGARSDFFAPLQGYAAHLAVFERPLTAAQAKQLYDAAGPRRKVANSAVPPKAALKLDSQPLSPAEGLKTIQVPDGFTVDLVASEPQVLDPVAFDWDSRGRLWVAEMADYPMGVDGKNGAGGRVRLLEDKDGDGHYETGTLFADGLNFPNGILTWRDGVIVTAAPDILFLRDTDNDGKLDKQEVLLTGLSQGNQQLRANGLRWGLDNWVYVAAGGHHSKHALNTKVRSLRADAEVAVGSRDFRFRPDTGELQPQSGPSQFGRNRDAWGRWFGTQNIRPLWHYVLPDHYLQRNPHLAAPEGRVLLSKLQPPVYPASKAQKRYHGFDHPGKYTSACAGTIYRDTKLFPTGTHAFACEPFQNLVQRIELSHDGVTFRGKRGGPDGKPDFFASTDRWCRPVMPRTGPDGALWVADMYRYMIEHPQWLPKVGKDELLPFYREGQERGRIYRVRRTTMPVTSVEKLVATDTAGLIQQLGASNGWLRDKAQMELLWRGDKSVTLGVNAAAPLSRLQALCTLDGLGTLTPEAVLRALADKHPGVRENALRLAETRATPAVQAAALKLVDDPDMKVRMQLAFSIGQFPPSDEAGKALVHMLHQHANDHFLRTAILSSALPHQWHLYKAAAASGNPNTYEPLLEMAIGSKNQEALNTLTSPIINAAGTSFSDAEVMACVDLLDLLARRKQPLPKTPAWQALLSKARSQKSIAAETLLSRMPSDRGAAMTALGARLNPATPPDDLRRILDALAGTGDKRARDAMLSAWPGLGPAARGDVLDRLLSRTAWTKTLLTSAEKSVIKPADVDAARRERLRRHPDKTIRAAATKWFGAPSSKLRASVVASYDPALKLKGDVKRGHAVYLKACASCHKHGDDGIDIGPDLRSVAAHPPEKLLSSILDPSVDIQPGFHAYQCTTKDGRELFGIVTSESAASITMKLPDGRSEDVLRSDIASLRNLGVSLMPEGLEGAIDKQAMADLIAFLRKQ